MIEFTIAPIGTVADHMARVRADELELLAAGVVSPVTMPARRPRHTWSPPSHGRPSRQPAQPAQPQASPDNARARRARRNGWHA